MKYIELSASDFSVCLDSENGHLKHLEYCNQKIDIRSKIWCLHTKQGEFTIDDMDRFYVQSYDSVRKLFWENDDAKICVTLTSKDGQMRWNINAEVFGDNAINQVQFPILEGLKFNTENYLLLTWQNGRILKNPVDGLLSKGEKIQPYVGRGIYAYESEYPAGLSFQYTAFYSPLEYGYYFSTEDSEAYIKTYGYYYNKEKHALDYILINYPENMGKTKSYSMPYDFVFKLFEGDWQTATNIYRTWAVEQKWCVKRLIEKKIPEKVIKTDLWRINHTNYNLGTRTQEYFDTSVMLRDKLNCNLSLHWYGWNMRDFHGQDYPDYISKEKKAEGWPAKLKKWNERFSAEGISKIPFTNARLWERTSETFKSCNVEAAAIKNKNGDIPFEYWGERMDLRPVCPATAMWQNKVVDYCREYIIEGGFDGVYLDQIASFNASLCFDETHSHPVGGGNWWNNSYHRMIRSVRELLGENSFITTESCCETYIDVLDMFLVLDTNMQYGAFNSLTGSGIATSVPLFNMIYGEHALSYGSICRFSDRIDRFEYNLVRNTLWGILPCIEGVDIKELENGADHLKITKKVVDFFKDHKQTILYGRICEIPDYTCEILEIDWEGKCEGNSGGRFTYKESYPAVYAVIWKKPNDERILFAYNFSDDEQIIEISGNSYNVPPKSFGDFVV